MSGLRLKRGDLVKVIAGSHKGKSGKVVAVLPKVQAVRVEGIHVVKRHVKPNTLQPQGGTKELHKPINISKVQLLSDDKKTSRIGYKLNEKGEKLRVLKQLKNKEIK